MRRSITICVCCLMSLFAAIGQQLPAVSPTRNISSLQQQIKNRKDSIVKTTDRFIHVGQPKDTGSPAPGGARLSVPLARTTDTIAEPPVMFLSLDHASCKGVIFIPQPGQFDRAPVQHGPTPAAPTTPAAHVPFLQVHGNIMYNLNYYSRIDTPFSEREIYQHTIQTWLDILLKGQYPMRIYLTNHFSNSNLFRNFSDLNFSYNNNRFNQQIRDRLRANFLQSLPSQKALDSLQRKLDAKWQQLKDLSAWMRNPAVVQHMVEAREEELRKAAKKKDTTSAAFSAPEEVNVIDSLYGARQREADSLRKEITGLQQLLLTTHQRSKKDVDQALQDIQRLDNPNQLRKKMQALGISDSSLPKGYQTLMAVRSFNIGRTVVNYSELSVKNISVNGVQAEYNPSGYYAFASGSVDYRFRDFLVQTPGRPKQYLNVVRVGKGLKDGNSVILTYFTGRRQLYNAATTDSPAVQVPSSSLMGLTLEGNYHINDHVLLTGEIAKSTSPSYTDPAHKPALASQLFSFRDRTNEAWAVRLNAYFPSTQTRFKGSYKHLSENYQSFSIFTDGSAQSAWSARIDQLLFRRQLEVSVGANTNDFSNPFISSEYKSTTVFKSVQVTLRKRRWPVLSAGYYPSSQITRLGKDQYIENLFYTLVGNMTHSYTLNGLMMNTALVYTQFYNRSKDSGFTYFNTRNLMLSQSFFLGKFTLQFNGSAASNQDYQLYMLEGKVQQTISKVLTLGAGVKYNKQTVYNISQLGYSADAALRIGSFGQLMLSADKGFIPGMNKQLVPDNTGRLTYYKTF